jgi:hypothetical protein
MATSALLICRSRRASVCGRAIRCRRFCTRFAVSRGAVGEKAAASAHCSHRAGRGGQRIGRPRSRRFACTGLFAPACLHRRHAFARPVAAVSAPSASVPARPTSAPSLAYTTCRSAQPPEFAQLREAHLALAMGQRNPVVRLLTRTPPFPNLLRARLASISCPRGRLTTRANDARHRQCGALRKKIGTVDRSPRGMR